MANYYLADCHFHHRNVIRYDSRPWASLVEMETALVQNWNRAVGDTDVVYIVGDFLWSKDPAVWMELTDQLHGKKVLIRGNHDLSREQMSPELLARFEAVVDYLEIVDEGRRVVLCHYPIMSYRGSYRANSYMLCGHVHATKENEYLELWRAQVRADPRGGCANVYNVGCMMPWMDYTPRTLDEILVRNEN